MTNVADHFCPRIGTASQAVSAAMSQVYQRHKRNRLFYSWPLSSVSHIFRFLDRMQPSLYVLTSLFAFSLLLSSQLMLCLLLDVCDFFGLFFVLLFLCVCGFSLFCHFLLVFNLLFVKIKKIKDKKKFLFR